MARTRSPINFELPAQAAGRVLPHDIAVEKAVLSALLHDNQAIHVVLNEVKPQDFYHPAHQQLYQSMIVLQDANQPVDLHTLAHHLNEQKLLDAVGGAVYLAEIFDYEVTAANVVQHARIVRDKSVKRSLIDVATEIVESGFEEAEAADRMLDQAESKVFDISRARSRETFHSLHDEMQEAMDFVERLLERGGEPTGVPTGLRSFDEKTGGLQPGELIIIAGRPSMGKTALALNIVRNAAIDHRKKAAVFSLEMTKRALTLRLLSSDAEVDLSRFHRGFGSAVDHNKMVKAAGDLADAEIWIDDSGMITILEIKAKCRRLASERGLDLVIVDYLQLAHGDRPAQRKDLEIGEISHGLKALAKELDIPVIALSQLNRGPEQRDPDKRRPNMGDLRESGAIEQDADLIAFIYRDEVYNPTEENRGLAEIIISKQRNGPTGTLRLSFEGRYAKFRDLADAPGDGVVVPLRGSRGLPGGDFDSDDDEDSPF